MKGCGRTISALGHLCHCVVEIAFGQFPCSVDMLTEVREEPFDQSQWGWTPCCEDLIATRGELDTEACLDEAEENPVATKKDPGIIPFD